MWSEAYKTFDTGIPDPPLAPSRNYFGTSQHARIVETETDAQKFWRLTLLYRKILKKGGYKIIFAVLQMMSE